MNQKTEIRESSRASDASEIERLYPDAFPDEDLLPIVHELLQQEEGVLWLVAVIEGKLVGHVVFATCLVDTGSEKKIALLAPLAVASAMQRRGVGSALVHDGLRRLERQGAVRVQVLGDPAYYGRFGFAPDEDITPPYPLPEECRTAWQYVNLNKDATALEGTLVVPPPWRQPRRWGA